MKKSLIVPVIASALALPVGLGLFGSTAEVSAEHHEAGDIVTTLMGNEETTMLVAAVTAAGLVETLQSDGPFTVFAPNNLAFEDFGEEEVAELLADQEALSNVLLYHVVPGKVMAADLAPGMVMTANGTSLTVDVVDGEADINGATVEQADIEVSNGVIHIINTVMDPAEAEDAEDSDD